MAHMYVSSFLNTYTAAERCSNVYLHFINIELIVCPNRTKLCTALPWPLTIHMQSVNMIRLEQFARNAFNIQIIFLS